MPTAGLFFFFFTETRTIIKLFWLTYRHLECVALVEKPHIYSFYFVYLKISYTTHTIHIPHILLIKIQNKHTYIFLNIFIYFTVNTCLIGLFIHCIMLQYCTIPEPHSKHFYVQIVTDICLYTT